MKDKLFGIGTILVGIMGLYGLYKACVEAASWLFVLIIGGISKFVNQEIAGTFPTFFPLEFLMFDL